MNHTVVFGEDVVDLLIKRARLAADDIGTSSLRLANYRMVVTFFDVVFESDHSVFAVLFYYLLDLFLFIVQHLFTDLIFVESQVILGEFFFHQRNFVSDHFDLVH